MAMQPRSSLNQGYTLLELLVVIAIIGLLAVSAIPAGRKVVEAAALRADVRAVVVALRQAQRRAVDEQRSVVVLVQASIPAESKDEIPLTSAGVLSMVGNTHAVEYFSDGTTIGGTLRLKEGHQSKDIHVAWLTGAITIGDSP